MDFEYESQGTITYLVYEIKSDDELDSMTLGMLTHNKIEGIVPTFFTQMDAKQFVKYNVSGMITVRHFLQGQVNKRGLLGVFMGIVNGLLSVEDYMIDSGAIVQDSNYIFVDVSTYEASLICLPTATKETRVSDWRLFLKDILVNAQLDQRENCDYISKILNYLNSNPALSLPDFKAFLNELRASDTVVKSKSAVTQQKSKQRAGELPYTPISTSAAQADPKPAAPDIPALGEETSQEEENPPISLFYLLQHYNKNNAEIYKKQKALKKEQTKQKAEKHKKTDKKQAAKQAALPNVNFAIPGQPLASPKASVGFAIPGVEEKSPSPVPENKGKPLCAHSQRGKEQAPAAVSSRPAKNLDFGETRYIYDASDSDFWNVNSGQESVTQEKTPYLILMRNNERIPINKNVFRLGRDRELSDYVVLDNKYVGHCHCHILTRDGEYFIVDDNSKNHTYVDGVMVAPESEVKISHGQTIMLANEKFEFRLI